LILLGFRGLAFLSASFFRERKAELQDYMDLLDKLKIANQGE
jgi:hypothetical protein